MSTVNWSLQHKRDTAANWTSNNPTLLAGQLGIETDNLTTTPKFKIGDGSSTWTALPYFYGGSASAQNLNNVLSVGSVTGGQDMTITADDQIKFGTGNAVIFNDSNIIDPSHVIIASNANYTGHTHLLVKDGGNEWHDESAGAFTSIMVGAVANNAIQLDDGNDKINIFSGANGLNLQNDTYLNSLTASRYLALDANKKIVSLSTPSITELGYLSGVTSNVQNQLDNKQPLDADLTSWAGVTRASGFDTFVATPSSANLSSLLTDKTGTGVNVFGTSPTFTTDITTPLIIGGSAVGSTISYKGTSGNGTTSVAAHSFLVGNNGATVAMEIFNSGNVKTINGNLIWADSTATTNIVYKGANYFLHNFKHPTGSTAIPQGFNLFLGENAGNLTTGSTATNTAFASRNVGIGREAMLAITNGYRNTSVGDTSLRSITTGAQNVAIGNESFYSLTTANNSVAIGNMAGRYLADGSTANTDSGTSIYIGASTKANAATMANEIVIGYNAIGKGSNTAIIGASNLTALYHYGRLIGNQGADVASANNLSLGTDGNVFEITGTTQINLISNVGWQNGSKVTLLFTSTPTVKHNQATSSTNITIQLAGAVDFVATAGDTLTLCLCEIGGTQTWREISRAVI